MTTLHLDRVARYTTRVMLDTRKQDLLRQIHTWRGQGWTWGDLTLALSDAVYGITKWDGPVQQAFREYAGPYKLFETVMQVLADAWGQERAREQEVEGMH